MSLTNSGLPPSSSAWGLANNDIIVVSEEGVKVKLMEPKLPAQFLSATCLQRPSSKMNDTVFERLKRNSGF